MVFVGLSKLMQATLAVFMQQGSLSRQVRRMQAIYNTRRTALVVLALQRAPGDLVSRITCGLL
jgi:DNA-binding transcriptional MocR family regulator